MSTINKELFFNKYREYSEALVDEELLARIKLLKKHTEAYRSILKLLNDLTSNMTCDVKFHRIEAKIVYHLASGELMWDALSDEGKRSVARNPDYVRAIDNGYSDIVPILAINRLIDYIRMVKTRISAGGVSIDELCQAMERSNLSPINLSDVRLILSA